ncbi:MAG TPA: hypothetical protein PKY31_11175 [Spirochaetota bacterium]|nr:hypothetical protein [Spirochaetota bacterium]
MISEKVRNFITRLSQTSPDAARDLAAKLGHSVQVPRAMHQGAHPAAGDDMSAQLARDRRALGLDAPATVKDEDGDTVPVMVTAADVKAAIRRDRLALGLPV